MNSDEALGMLCHVQVFLVPSLFSSSIRCVKRIEDMTCSIAYYEQAFRKLLLNRISFYILLIDETIRETKE
jgi:hypothetical protein